MLWDTKYIIATAIIAFLLGFVACNRSQEAQAKGTQARELVEKQGAQLVDVRSPAEFSSGHISGAKNIPLPELDARSGELSKDKPVVLYCRSGRRSATGAKQLEARGYKVYDLGAKSNW